MQLLRNQHGHLWQLLAAVPVMLTFLGQGASLSAVSEREAPSSLNTMADFTGEHPGIGQPFTNTDLLY